MRKSSNTGADRTPVHIVVGMVAQTDGRRIRGDRTRQRVLELASEVATLEGLGGLSLSHLGEALQLSKSGIHALFGTMEELQLETVAAARLRFIKVVVTPVFGAPPGLPRLRALTLSWLDYIRRREFPGGCFVSRWSAELASHPGRVHDALVSAAREWRALLEGEVLFAIESGDLPADTDAPQLVFEIDAFLVAGNSGYQLGDPDALGRAEKAVLAKLG